MELTEIESAKLFMLATELCSHLVNRQIIVLFSVFL
jgi:hypothetical protein